MKYGLTFLLLAVLCRVGAWMQESVWGRIVYVSLALCFVSVGAGFLWLGPRVFLKKSDGTLWALSYLLYWPYFLLNWLCLALVSRTRGGPFADAILPDLYLGRQTLWMDSKQVQERKFVAVLDLTCEFGETKVVRRLSNYRCIPLLDTTAPTEAQLREGVDFITSHISNGPVYVHCAMGAGRSATFVAAYLLAAQVVPDIEAAERFLKERRPAVGLHKEQRRMLGKFVEDLEGRRG